MNVSVKMLLWFHILTSVLKELTSAVLTPCVTTLRDHTIAPVVRVTMVTDKTVKVDLLGFFWTYMEGNYLEH